jgi:hypothetical protein
MAVKRALKPTAVLSGMSNLGVTRPYQLFSPKNGRRESHGPNVRFSDDHRFVVPVLLVFVLVFVLVLGIIIIVVVVGVSRRHRVTHDGDEVPVGQPGKVLGNARGHVGLPSDVATC